MSRVKQIVNYSISLSCPGYDISSDAWETTGPTYTECWKTINACLATHTYEAFDTKFHLTFDWSQMSRLILKMHRAHERLYRAKDEGKDPFRVARFPRRSAQIAIVSRADQVPDDEHCHASLILCRLHDIFLIANLSAPGSGDFNRVTVRKGSQRNYLSHNSLNASGFYFNLAFIDTQEGKWPPVKNLRVEKVASWYSTVRTGYSQVPRNNA